MKPPSLPTAVLHRNGGDFFLVARLPQEGAGRVDAMQTHGHDSLNYPTHESATFRHGAQHEESQKLPSATGELRGSVTVIASQAPRWSRVTEDKLLRQSLESPLFHHGQHHEPNTSYQTYGAVLSLTSPEPPLLSAVCVLSPFRDGCASFLYNHTLLTLCLRCQPHT